MMNHHRKNVLRHLPNFHLKKNHHHLSCLKSMNHCFCHCYRCCNFHCYCCLPVRCFCNYPSLKTENCNFLMKFLCLNFCYKLSSTCNSGCNLMLILAANNRMSNYY